MAAGCGIPQRESCCAAEAVIRCSNLRQKALRGYAKRQQRGEINEHLLAEPRLKQTRGPWRHRSPGSEIEQVGHGSRRLTVAPWLQRTDIGHDLQFRPMDVDAGLHQRAAGCGFSTGSASGALGRRGDATAPSNTLCPWPSTIAYVQLLKRDRSRARRNPPGCAVTTS